MWHANPMKNPAKPEAIGAENGRKAVKGRRSISHYLAALIFVSVVPLLCFLAYTVITTARAETERAERQADHLADTLARTLDVEWAALEASLVILAEAPVLKQRKLLDFEREAHVFGRHNGASIMLVAPDGEILLNLRAPPGARHGKTANMGLVEEVLRTGKPLVSNAYEASLDRQIRIASFVPVMIDNQPAYVVVATWSLSDLAQRLEGSEIGIPPGWLATVIDGNGVRVWGNLNSDLFGETVSPDFAQAAQQPLETRRPGVTSGGVGVVTFTHRLGKASWTAVIGVPEDDLYAPFRRSIVFLSLIAALVLALSLSVAALISRRLKQALRAAETDALRLGHGDAPVGEEADIRELQGLGLALLQAGRQRDAAESALRRSEARFRGAIEGLIDAFEILAPIYDDAGRLLDFRFEYMNRRASLAVAQEGRHEIVGHPARSHFPPGAWERLAPEFERVLRNGEPYVVDSLPFIAPRDSSSTGVFIDLRAWRLDDKLAVSWRGVTPRIRMERALRDSELRLNRAQAMAHLGSWELDLTKSQLTWSDEVFRIFGLQPQQFTPTYEEFLATVHPDDRTGVDAAYTGSLLMRRDSYEIEHRIVRRASGEIRIVHQRGEHVRDADGRIIRSLGTVHDITERKQGETALRQAKAEAERANNAKSRFLAAASHDLRQPLSALALYVGMLKHKLPPNLAALHANMVDCVGSLSGLLTDLLDVSKLDAGVVTPNVTDFAIAELIAQAAAVHRPEAELKRLRLRIVPSTLTARTDPVLMTRMLGNLIDNAIRYTERGGVVVGCRRRCGKVWIEVWDSGIGIADDKTSEIFEEFRQLGNEARNGGSGLGLAIVAKAAALLGLQIRVSSRVGKGSLFALELPLGNAKSEAPRANGTPQGGLRIALVEDNSVLREALVYALEEVGHQVFSAAGGRQLMTQLGGRAPDVVISDYRISSSETGFDIVTAVRAAFGAELPAVIITGDTDPDLMRSMADRGILVQHKPVDVDTLQVCIGQVMQLAASRATTRPFCLSAAAAGARQSSVNARSSSSDP
jgi:PAS domain S-box-containing protein